MLVSIIITNYNYKHLYRCIRSCLNQSMPINNFEVIVVDDSSKDNSNDIIEEYKSLPNFRYLRNKKLCVAKSANNAIKKSKGKYVVRVTQMIILIKIWRISYLFILKESG